MKAVITGAGIGGLTAALCLHHVGHDAIILERADTISEVGAGIQISPNAMHVMRALGLDDIIIARGFLPRASQMRIGRNGRELMSNSMAHYPQLYGAPYVHIHRADLIAILQQAVEERLPKALRLKHNVTGYDQDGKHAYAILSDGARVKGDVLIGADGIKSVIRTQIHGAQQPRFTGNIAWRAVVPVERLGRNSPPPNASVWLGDGKHAVTYLLRGGSLANFVGVVERRNWQDEDWTAKGSRRDVLADFAGWHPIITTIIQQADSHYCWALFDRKPLNSWHDGHVVLLGDACHPMPPFMAQGAAQAIEDGYVLAQNLSQDNAPDTAFRHYYKARFARTKKVQQQAWDNMRLFHQGPGIGRVAQHGPLWLAGKADMRVADKMLSWLYGHNVTL